MKLAKIVVPLVLMGLVGCKSTQPEATKNIVNVPLAVPLQANFRNEIAIARFNELLLQPDMVNEQRAQLLYNRGMLYDSIGLQTLARIDFNRAVKIKPDLAEVYNFLGIHQTLEQNYGRAYEMFDAVLELDEQHEYAYLNRGIALYYGERADLAVKDFEAFLARAPKDAYRAMWLYIAQQQVDGALAKQTLAANSQALDPDEWSSQLVALYLGTLSEEAFLAQISDGVSTQEEYAQRLCEAYFYLAKRYQTQGDLASAISYFKLALATNVYEFVEHKYARLELDLLAQLNDEQDAS
ncbi:lipoprotein NlpI [Pseudoalteromonas piscicida]|uniref:lipoprotein NlpI n=1 Tax=Pseudoalteromonas piscicida TaxID=43662 RepID=UPI0027E40E9F|nr:lipoprotein NlpI [Pseudoalteromonas piscicida]WMO14398.1 lipoprotein NlpI [Pseudoalteromonas piscicida]